MSSKARPWYPWYPNDFYNDDNVKLLSFEAESIYRRILDALWRAKKCRIKDDIETIYRLSCKDLPFVLFQNSYKELDDLNIFSKTNGFITSPRLIKHYKECLERSEQAKKNINCRWKKHKKK